jgi:hypothetical protein
MEKQYSRLIWIVFLALFLAAQMALMQAAAIPVPNLVGMNVPQAAAALNRAGLALGAQTNSGWTAESGLAQNTIGTQSLPPDQLVPSGTSVDVLVLRSPNVALIYDENDITIINNTNVTLDLNGLVFGVVDAPKDIEGCAHIDHWMTSVNNTAEHFWTGLNGVVTFSLVYNGVQQGTCPAAPAGAQPMRCDIYVPIGDAVEVTPYIYFAYTPERLIVYNRSQDKWMPLGATPIINLNPNVSVPEPQINLSDPTVVTSVNPVAHLDMLAPNQCLLFTNNSSPEVPNLPEPCDVVGQGNIDPNLIFWSASFDILSVTDGRRRTCAAATPGRLTICVMPR